VDLLVEFNRPVGYFGLFALQDYLEKLLDCSVDLGTPDSLKPYIRERVMGNLIQVIS
jgi:predicted nucleotidyltransferase